MKLTKTILAAGALSLASFSGAAMAQDAPAAVKPNVATGVTVYGPQGNEVGNIVAMANGIATLDTGTYKVGLPLDRFGMNADKQTTVAVTKEQLNQMMADAQAKAAAQLDAALVTGAPVVDVDGVSLGSVGTVEGDKVTVETEWGAFALQKGAFQAGNGNVIAQVKADQVKTALGATADASAQS